MQYKVYGPFAIPRENGLLQLNGPTIKTFWDEIGRKVEGLPQACGCYIFSIGIKPWYVGLASGQFFRAECFSVSKKAAYLAAYNNVDKGVPRLTLIAKLTPQKKRFCKPSVNLQNDIYLLEDLLIGMALRKNPKLINIAKTKLLKEMHVPGILNTGTGEGAATAVQYLRQIMGT